MPSLLTKSMRYTRKPKCDLYTGKNPKHQTTQSIESISESIQIVNLIDKDFKEVINIQESIGNQIKRIKEQHNDDDSSNRGY